jgi:alanyl-tRNA synthetase
MPDLVATAIDVMGEAYPDLKANADLVTSVMVREEEQFRRTLAKGLTIFGERVDASTSTLSGSDAFLLHDTYGFPLEVTKEIADERGIAVDEAGFDVEMAEQRRRAKEARKGGTVDDERQRQYRELVEMHGATAFTGYVDDETVGRVLAVLHNDDGTVEAFLDQSPFYAESGGQVGDTGTIVTETGTITVSDTTSAVPGLRRHVGRLTVGVVDAGQLATATVDAKRRNDIRKNHTGTHLLHWALREVLGKHVKQQGSYVDDQRLRFDFSHTAALTPDEIEQIEWLANREVLANDDVTATEMPKAEAEQRGAIAFFGDKYGDLVRVLEAGTRSIEFCGGTHVHATGDIGTIKIVSESSIGSGIRRIEAVTGEGSVALLQRDERQLANAAKLLSTTSDKVLDGIESKLAELDDARREIKALRAKLATGRAPELAASAVEGVVIARVDDMNPGDLRELALAVRQQSGVRAVVLGGTTDTGGAALVAAVTADAGLAAGDLVKPGFGAIGGGGNAKGDVVAAGGRNPAGVDEALTLARAAAGV